MENDQHQIIPITETQIPAAAALLAEAFFDDVLMAVLFPDNQERLRVLTWYYTATIRSLAPLQGVYSTAGVVKGVAVWDPPGTEDEIPAWPEQTSAQAYRRFLDVMNFLTPLRQAAMPEPFWYLSWLAVAASHQRQHLGSALLAPILLQADRNGFPCYLETFVQKNLLFYQHHGFEIVLNGSEPQSGIPFWTMKREPRQP